MSNSALASYAMISPCRTSPREHKIDTITIHCVVGQLSAEGICGCFANMAVGASCNYAIGTDGRIGLCVEEKDRSWCSSSPSNDHRAVTIECASDRTHPYAINDKVYRSLVSLCADICRRNGIQKLIWKADKSLIGQPDKQNMTVHRWFANKACPGDYIYDRLGRIAIEVNAKLGAGAIKDNTEGLTKIMGTSVATAEQMKKYIRAKNPGVSQSVLDMVPLYLSEGKAEGVRGDIAFAQSCLETGNFTFKGSAVTLAQNNFCGMGVTANGMKGNSFKDPKTGIRAQIQHLKAYASTEGLKNKCVDPRYAYVEKGCARYVEWLGIQENPKKKGWAAGSGYGRKILGILDDIIGISVPGKDVEEKYMFEMRPVKKGERGNHVLLVQEILLARGFKGKDGKPLELDKHCDVNTVYAIKQYQKSREKVDPGICGGVDGVAGLKTLQDMIAL